MLTGAAAGRGACGDFGAAATTTDAGAAGCFLTLAFFTLAVTAARVTEIFFALAAAIATTRGAAFCAAASGRGDGFARGPAEIETFLADLAAIATFFFGAADFLIATAAGRFTAAGRRAACFLPLGAPDTARFPLADEAGRADFVATPARRETDGVLALRAPTAEREDRCFATRGAARRDGAFLLRAAPADAGRGNGCFLLTASLPQKRQFCPKTTEGTAEVAAVSPEHRNKSQIKRPATLPCDQRNSANFRPAGWA